MWERVSVWDEMLPSLRMFCWLMTTGQVEGGWDERNNGQGGVRGR